MGIRGLAPTVFSMLCVPSCIHQGALWGEWKNNPSAHQLMGCSQCLMQKWRQGITVRITTKSTDYNVSDLVHRCIDDSRQGLKLVSQFNAYSWVWGGMSASGFPHQQEIWNIGSDPLEALLLIQSTKKEHVSVDPMQSTQCAFCFICFFFGGEGRLVLSNLNSSGVWISHSHNLLLNPTLSFKPN